MTRNLYGNSAARTQHATGPMQGDLFICDGTNWPVKDDLASMEIPLFSLAKQPDISVRKYKRGNKVVTIYPSVAGAATVFDKDLLLYIASQIVAALNLGQPVSRTVKINSVDFLKRTDRGDGRASFENLVGMLRRLRGTTVETNIVTGGIMQTKGFGLIEDYTLLSEKTSIHQKLNKEAGRMEKIDVRRVLCFTVTISEWLYNGLLDFEALTIDQSYFQLSRAISRKLYELARKHCGEQPLWKINIDLLAEKVGTTRERFKFRDEIRSEIVANRLPGYRIALDTSSKPDDVIFYSRDSAKLFRELSRTNNYGWFEKLERCDNLDLWRKTKQIK